MPNPSKSKALAAIRDIAKNGLVVMSNSEYSDMCNDLDRLRQAHINQVDTIRDYGKQLEQRATSNDVAEPDLNGDESTLTYTFRAPKPNFTIDQLADTMLRLKAAGGIGNEFVTLDASRSDGLKHSALIVTINSPYGLPPKSVAMIPEYVAKRMVFWAVVMTVVLTVIATVVLISTF